MLVVPAVLRGRSSSVRPLSEVWPRNLPATLSQGVPQLAGVVVASDRGRGVLGPRGVELILRAAILVGALVACGVEREQEPQCWQTTIECPQTRAI